MRKSRCCLLHRRAEKLERLALERRPEIMEEWYRKRVTENDIKAAKLLLWPNLVAGHRRVL